MDEFLIAIFGIMIPITALIMTGIVLIALMHYRNRERDKLHDTLRQLGQTESPHQAELIGILTKASTPQPDRDLRMAFFLFTAAAGLVALAFMVGIDEFDGYEVVWPLVAVAVFPFAFGIGRLVLWNMSKKRGEG